MSKHDREFVVETPMGILKAKASHDVDLSMDYPGIHIFLVKEDGDEVLLSVTEYESTKDYIQSVVYADAFQDEPTHVIPHSFILAGNKMDD